MDHDGDKALDLDVFMNNKCSSKACPDKCSMEWKIYQGKKQKQIVNSSVDVQGWFQNDEFDIICKGLSFYVVAFFICIIRFFDILFNKRYYYTINFR